MSEIQVSEIFDRYPAERTSSLAVLEDIQREYKYLPREALEATAERLRLIQKFVCWLNIWALMNNMLRLTPTLVH